MSPSSLGISNPNGACIYIIPNPLYSLDTQA